MPAVYPTGYASFPALPATMDVAPTHTTNLQQLRDEMAAVQTTGGLSPQGSDASIRARLDRMDKKVTSAGIVDGFANTTSGTTPVTIVILSTTPPGVAGNWLVWAHSHWTQTVSTDSFGLFIQPSTGGNLAAGVAPAVCTCSLSGRHAYVSGALSFSLVLTRLSGTGTATNAVTDGSTQINALFVPT